MRNKLLSNRTYTTIRTLPPDRHRARFSAPLQYAKQIAVSGLIVAILLFIIINFYSFASVVNLYNFFYVFLIFSLLTDGLYILIQLIRRKIRHRAISYDPSKVTIVIACYNGQDVIGNTIEHALDHVGADQIIVVSDASTDDTVKIAHGYGVNVIQNKTNLSKAFSIHKAVARVNTPYVLLLDDDVLLGNATIPTSLLDDGYTAVAFNVMPVAKDTLINRLQVFEYRNSMQIGKNLRGNAGAIGNVSGAIGLYRTKDLIQQFSLHSGQFAGEDEQRTLLAHLYGTGKGITYSDDVIYTLVPKNIRSLYRQRAYSWSLAVPELFILYWRILFSPKFHYLLKIEKAYYLYIYLTDPLRILFLWALFLRPRNMIFTYVFYLVFNALIWMRLGMKDSFTTVMVYPFYKLWLMVCRFIGNFYWFKVKAIYMRKRLHRSVTNRKLLNEYVVLASVFIVLWSLSVLHFRSDLNMYNSIRSNRLEDPIKDFEYEQVIDTKTSDIRSITLAVKTTPPQAGTFIPVRVEKGDTNRSIVHKAVDQVLASRTDIVVPYKDRAEIEAHTLASLRQSGVYISPASVALIEISQIENSIYTTLSSTKSLGG